ncbi:hypothetical protein NLU13_5690 [Sarocladium strictum]|uniref:Uncharacterized protein n=1 Tax=Sarocladium strictum TaxID=5046 RepID=A0AA39L7W4_SARSR|nr:hypothetical protein NLU13_5690 [Sarocladium strictum]
MSKTQRFFLLLALLANTSCAYEYDEDVRPCEEDKCFIDIHSDAPRCWIQDGNQVIDYMSPMGGGTHRIPNACMRSNIFGGDGYLAACPSAGGVMLLKTPSAVDLHHLGLPNTYDAVRPADEDEDGIATRMAQLGAQWWPDWDIYLRHSARVDGGVFYDYHFPSSVDVAYPAAGGVWVANFTRDAQRYQYEDKACESWLPHAPALWPLKLRYALTMDDKAEIIKSLGGTFYSSADQVPGLARSVDQAVGLFEPFKKRLKNMEDDDYRRRFCAHDGTEDVNSDDSVHQSSEAGNHEPKKPRWGTAWLFPELR